MDEVPVTVAFAYLSFGRRSYLVICRLWAHDTNSGSAVGDIIKEFVSLEVHQYLSRSVFHYRCDPMPLAFY